jgi:cytoskeletal protein CcmA (bactofilin family)
MKTKTVVINNGVSGGVNNVDNVVIYGRVIGDITNCENVYIIGGDVVGNVNSNGMVFECDKLPIMGDPIQLAL